jgi:hypothetical protein
MTTMTIENKAERGKEFHHCWPQMTEYKFDTADGEILMDLSDGNLSDIIKKLSPNQYLILRKNEKVEGYFRMIEKLKEQGLDVGKGDCQYGWHMPIINKKRELRIFRRH